MQTLRIDIISDVMCPWCVVGFFSLQQALGSLQDEVKAHIHWQPFELNPDMPAAGENMQEHLIRKYQITAAQSTANRAMIAERGAAVGFKFDFSAQMRLWNTFAAHQLLYWLGETQPEQQTALKLALFAAHFQQHKNISDSAVLVQLAADLGLDAVAAEQVLTEGTYAKAVSAAQTHWRQAGISSVPAFILQQKILVSGGQPVEVFVDAIRQALQTN